MVISWGWLSNQCLPWRQLNCLLSSENYIMLCWCKEQVASSSGPAQLSAACVQGETGSEAMQQEYWRLLRKYSSDLHQYIYISYLLLVCRYSYANHLFLPHYELHAEVKSIHRSSVGMLPMENMLICNISKQKMLPFDIDITLEVIFTVKNGSGNSLPH